MAVTLLTCVLAPVVRSVHAADGAKPLSYGARAAGRAGVDYAIADDATAPATNPAGIAFSPNRLDSTFFVGDASGSFANSLGKENTVPRLLVPLPGYSFGAIFDVTRDWHVGALFDLGNWGLKPDEGAKDPPWERFTPEDRFLDQVVPAGSKPNATPAPASTGSGDDEELYGGRFRFGIGVFPVSGGSFNYRHILTPFWLPAAEQYRTDAQQLAVTPSIAFRITKQLSVGWAPQFQYATFKLTGPIQQGRNLLAPQFQLASSLLNSATILSFSNSHDLSTFGFSHRFGILYRLLGEDINDDFPLDISLGAVYQDRTYLQDYLGSGGVDSSVQTSKLTFGSPGLLAIIDPKVNPSLGFNSLYDMRVQKFQFPRMIGAGFAIQADRLMFGLDYTFINWSELYRVFQVRLTNPSNPNMLELTGPALHVHVPLEYKDQHCVSVGASFVVLQGDDIIPNYPSYQFILRAGYNWCTDPVPSTTAIPQTPIFFQHHVTGGFTFKWGPYLEFNFAVEHAFYQSMRTTTSDVNNDLDNSHQSIKFTSYYFGTGVLF